MLDVQIYSNDGQTIAEFVSDSILLAKTQDALDLMVNPAVSGSKKLIIHRKNIAPEFFDLKNGIAGEILQKLVTYQVQLAIVGDFSDITSDSMKALIIESNRGRDLFFLDNVEKAKEALFNN